MVWHIPAKGGRTVPCRLVATVAIRVRGREIIVVVDVAVRAGVRFARRGHLMRTRQRPAGRAVIEDGSGLRDRVVARRAVGCRKRCSASRVRRVIGLLPGRQVASGIPAVGRLDREGRVIPQMALIAARDLSRRRDLVCIRQRKARVGVIKSRIGPHIRVMALAAQGGRESRGNVVRHTSAKGGRTVPGRLVATVAIRVRGREIIVVVDVAVRAGVRFACRRHLVRTRQRPAGRAVIEDGSGPRDRVVARRAVGCRKRCSGSRVRRVIGLLPGRQVASGIPAVGRLDRQIVIVVDVTVRAGTHLARRGHLVRIR